MEKMNEAFTVFETKSMKWDLDCSENKSKVY
jgi:hypothetical protein